MADRLSIEHTTFAQIGPVTHTATRNMPVHCVISRLVSVSSCWTRGSAHVRCRTRIACLGEDALFKLGIMVDPRLTVFERLRSRGIGPEQVTDIILTYLDNDHAGGVHDFPTPPYTFSQEELTGYDGTRARGPYKPYQISHLTNFRPYEPTGEMSFDLSARSLQLPGDLDAKLVPLPGHTMGHCGVAYREEGRWSLHPGDAYFDSKVNFLDPAPGLPIEIAFSDQRHRSAGRHQEAASAPGRTRRRSGTSLHSRPAGLCELDCREGKPDPISSAILLV